MKLTCPNINDPAFQALVKEVGKFQAYKDYLENDGEIRPVSQVKDKLDAITTNRIVEVKPRTDREVLEDQLLESGAIKRNKGNLVITQHGYNDAVRAVNELRKSYPGIISIEPAKTTTGVGGRSIWLVKISDRSLKKDLGQSIDPGVQLNMFFREDGKPDMLAANQDYAQAAINTLATNLATNLGVSYQMISSSEAKDITQDSQNPWNGEPAFYDGNTVYFVGDNITPEILLHEFSHPLVRSISSVNPELFTNLYDNTVKTSEGLAILANVKELYPEIDESDPLFKEEVIVRAIQKVASDQTGGVKTSVPFWTAVRNILYHIKQMLRKVFGSKIKVEDLNADTNLDELANMLKGDKFDLSKTKLTEADLIAYAREQKDETEAMKKIDGKVRVMLSNKMYSIAREHLEKLRSNKNYSAMLDVLSDQFDSNKLKEIQDNLSTYHGMLENEIEALNQDIRHVQLQVSGMVTSMYKLDDVSALMISHMQEISSGALDQDSMKKLTQYNQFIDWWGNFLDNADSALRDSGIDSREPIRVLIARIQSKFDDGRKASKKVYEMSSLQLMKDTLKPLADNIDETYQELLSNLKKKNAPQWLIDKHTQAYEQARLSPHTNRSGDHIDPIKKIMAGEAGDANAVNSFLEGFMYSSDPIVGGFALFLKNNITDVNTTAQAKKNKFLQEMNPLLKDIGFTGINAQKLGKDLTFTDTVADYDEDGNFTKREIYTFLNPHKDYRFKLSEMEHNADAARDLANKTKSDEDYKKAAELYSDLKKHKRSYFWQEYHDSFYEREKLLDNPIGKKAWLERQLLLDQIKELQQSIVDDYTETETTKEIDNLWRKYNQLHALVDDLGKMKTGEDLEKAKILKQYREMSRYLYNWKQIPGSFQRALMRQEQDLVDRGFVKGGEEYNKSRQQWIDDNTVVKVKDEYYALRNIIYERIKAIKESLGKQSPLMEDVDKAWQTIQEAMIGFKDEDNQPNADEMSPERIALIRDAQGTINKLRDSILQTAGLTEEEAKTLEELFKKPQEERSKSDKKAIAEILTKKKASGLSVMATAELTGLYAMLSEMESKQATDYYVNHANAWLSTLDTSTLKSSIGANSVSNTTADFLLSRVVINDLLGQGNEEFNQWFKNNHIEKEVYDPITKSRNPVWQRLYVWNVTRPASENFYETTDILDEAGNKTETIKGAPAKRFYYREVKPEFRTDRIVGKTIDGKGNWLPKTIAQGVPADTPYVNKAYYDLQKDDPKLFKVLEKIKENHVDNQIGLQNSSKLYLDIPRFRKDTFEAAQDITISGVKTSTEGWLHRIRDFFKTSADDAAVDQNYDKQFNLVKADIFDNQQSSVPIMGLFKIEPDQVSLDVMHGVMRYMYSAERQKKLLEIAPAAKALRDVMKDKDLSGIKDLSKINKEAWLTTQTKRFLNKKGESIRAKAIENLYAREFEGEVNTGFAKDAHGLNKVTSFMFKSASFGFFALNIPSALKNSFSAMFQNMIMAAGQKDLDVSTYHKGVAWSAKVSTQMSSQLYNMDTKSMETQLVDIFDAHQGRFEEHFGSDTSRNISKDVLNFSWMMSPRKWTEVNATLGLFGGMMMYKKIDRVIDGVTKKIDYIDAWEVKDGQIQLKSGIDPVWGQGGDKFKEFRNKIHMASNDLNGAFSKFDQPEAQRYLAYRTISYMRRYLTSMFTHRWGSNRINVGHGRMTEGFYRTNVKSLGKIIEGLRKGTNYMQYMTPIEKQAFLKLTGEAMQLLLLYMVTNVFLGWDSDDKERYSKLRAESGPLPLPGVKDTMGKDFDFFGYSHAHAILLSMNIMAENQQWMNPKDYLQNLDFKSVAFGPTLKAYTDLLSDVFLAATGNDQAYYKKQVGPYYWQDDESWKFWNHAGHMVGLTGGTVDPVLAIKNFQAVRVRR